MIVTPLSILVRAWCPDIGVINPKVRSQLNACKHLLKNSGKDLFDDTRKIVDEPPNRPPRLRTMGPIDGPKISISEFLSYRLRFVDFVVEAGGAHETIQADQTPVFPPSDRGEHAELEKKLDFQVFEQDCCLCLQRFHRDRFIVWQGRG